MARPLRIEYKGAWYHVLNRGRRREKVFFDDADYRFFMKLLGECRAQFEVETHAYSLIPNHYHLIVRTPEANLSRMMRHLNGVYTQYINRKYKLEGSLFKGRFKAIVIERESYLLELVRYIHRNPYKAKLEDGIGQHKWTSHRAYMREKERPQWLVVNGVLERFSRYEKEALKELDLFVRKQSPRELEQRLDGMNWPAVLGGEFFKEQLRELVLGKELDFSEVPKARSFGDEVSVETVARMAEEVAGVAGGSLAVPRMRGMAGIKKAFVYVCRHELQCGQTEICEELGGVNRAVATRLHAKACEDVGQKRGAYRLVQRLKKRLSQQVKT